MGGWGGGKVAFRAYSVWVTVCRMCGVGAVQHPRPAGWVHVCVCVGGGGGGRAGGGVGGGLRGWVEAKLHSGPTVCVCVCVCALVCVLRVCVCVLRVCVACVCVWWWGGNAAFGA